MKINPSPAFLCLFLPSTAQRGHCSCPVLMVSPSLLPGVLLPCGLGQSWLPWACCSPFTLWGGAHTAPLNPRVTTRGLTYSAQSGESCQVCSEWQQVKHQLFFNALPSPVESGAVCGDCLMAAAGSALAELWNSFWEWICKEWAHAPLLMWRRQWWLSWVGSWAGCSSQTGLWPGLSISSLLGRH